MSLWEARQTALARLTLWEPGQADPVLAVREYVFHEGPEALGGAFPRGEVSLAGHEPALEWLPGVGLTCRAFLEAHDTRLADYATAGGSWEERRPAFGWPRRYRLVQFDTSPGVAWRATSRFALPASPSLAVTLWRAETPPDWDDAAPPYARVELGPAGLSGAVAIEVSRTLGTRLLAWDTAAGGWRVALALPGPRRGALLDGDEQLLLLRCHRGRVGVSTDGGRDYTWYLPETGTPVPAGPVTFRGRGGMAAWGLHGLRYHSGWWRSPARPTGTPRSPGAALELQAWAEADPGTVLLEDDSLPEQGLARYRALLSPEGTLLGAGWTAWRSPALHAVTGRYPAVPSLYGFTGEHGTPFPDVLSARVVKPRELAAAEAVVECRLPPESVPESAGWRWGRFAKARLELGHARAGEEPVLHTVLVGFVVEAGMAVAEGRAVTLRLRLASVAERFRAARWTRLDAVPLGGRLLFAALDLILETEGVPRDTSYRDWSGPGAVLGAEFLLPAGSAEAPLERPPAGESKWETMQRLAGYAGLEVVPRDDGVLTVLPVGYVAPYLSRIYHAAPEEEVTALVRRLEWSFLSRESATAVLVEGTAPDGTPLAAWAVDAAAEGVTASPRFSPFRVCAAETVEGAATPGLLAARAAALAASLFPNVLEAHLAHPADLTVGRREVVRVGGLESAGVAPERNFVVAALRHRYEARGGFGPELETTAELLLLE
jgi:hypothetical protein